MNFKDQDSNTRRENNDKEMVGGVRNATVKLAGYKKKKSQLLCVECFTFHIPSFRV